MIEIVSTGALVTVQDLGRRHQARLGVPRSGAFDRGAARLANRLVGNPEDAALLEATLGLTFRLTSAATVAATGALCAGFDWNAAISLPAGTTVALASPRQGLRSYVAFRGGISVDAVLGSRSTDILSGLGPAPLQVGDQLGLGPEPELPVLGASAPPMTSRQALRYRWGPRDDWFTAAARALFTSSTWLVRADSNRIGVRLDGPALDRRVPDELPSEPTLPGAVQVPPDGRPIIFGPDAPVTGGYPVIVVLDDASLDAAAQLRPGDTVRFSNTVRFG